MSRTATWTCDPSLRNEPGNAGAPSVIHPANGTDPHTFTFEDRNRELDDLAVEPVFVARLPGNRKTLLPAGSEQLVVRQGQERYPAHTVLEVDAVLEADVGPDDRRLARMRSFRPCAGLGQPVLEEVDAVPEAVVVVVTREESVAKDHGGMRSRRAVIPANDRRALHPSAPYSARPAFLESLAIPTVGQFLIGGNRRQPAAALLAAPALSRAGARATRATATAD